MVDRLIPDFYVLARLDDGQLKKGDRILIKNNGEFVPYVRERTCRIVKTWSDSDYVNGWRYRCSECSCPVTVNEIEPETGDVISASNYCSNCGARVISEEEIGRMVADSIRRMEEALK